MTMILKDTNNIIAQLEKLKFISEGNDDCKMFNLGIDRAIDIINNAPIVDAKVKIDKKTYHREYYQKVTKFKRAKKREEKKNNLGGSNEQE